MLEEERRAGTAGVLLPLLNREHTDLLSVCLVLKLHCGTEEKAPGGHKGSAENHRLPSSLAGRTAQLPPSQKGEIRPAGLITPRSQTDRTTAIRQEILVHENKNKQTTKQFLSNSHNLTKCCYQSIVVYHICVNTFMKVYVCVCVCVSFVFYS